MKQIVSTRLVENLSHDFSLTEDKIETIEKMIEQLDGKCPHCEKQWPRKKPGVKSYVSFRIKPENKKTLKLLANKSRYLSSVISLALGYCPVCEQKV